MRSYTILLFGILVLAFIPACQNKAMFGHSMVVPLAYGNVSVDEVDDRQFLIEVEVNYLTNPENIDPSASYYTAWAISRRDTQRIGVLNHRSMEEANVIGEVEMREIDEVLITAESKASAQEMGDLIILRSENL